MKTGNWMTHLEYDLESPIWRHLYREMAKDRTLIRYDTRGNGLSDRTVDDISFDAFLSDLEAVIEASGVDRFALFGISQGCAVSIAYAVRHPERVTHLLLYGGYAVGWSKRARTAAQKDEDAAMLTLMRLGWGKENPAFRQMFTSLFIPGATKEQADWFNELQRITVSPEVAVRIFETTGETDVTALLPQVRVPTLVMHARDDARVPFDAGRRMAAGIPGARFVTLQGRNHLFLETEPAFGQFLEGTPGRFWPARAVTVPGGARATRPVADVAISTGGRRPGGPARPPSAPAPPASSAASRTGSAGGSGSRRADRSATAPRR